MEEITPVEDITPIEGIPVDGMPIEGMPFVEPSIFDIFITGMKKVFGTNKPASKASTTPAPTALKNIQQHTVQKPKSSSKAHAEASKTKSIVNKKRQ